MEYNNYHYTDKNNIQKMLDNNENIIEAIIGAINGINDQEWLEQLCLKYISSEDFGIARTAIYSFGDIARIYRQLLNRELIENQLSKITDEKLKYVIQEVKEDFEIFLKEN
ncbi:hypothetical protein [Chryseobacterium sp.]|uniref:hypothetical protein n=1 Tax=Chryseobacterium sp. TaxID=1871047 RepID=UPI00289E34C7|nr:hypothetical protein [Chryseobacterium sp.]